MGTYANGVKKLILTGVVAYLTSHITFIRAWGLGLESSDIGQPTSDFRLPTSEFRIPKTRLQKILIQNSKYRKYIRKKRLSIYRKNIDIDLDISIFFFGVDTIYRYRNYRNYRNYRKISTSILNSNCKKYGI